jgi:hypothetical protein
MGPTCAVYATGELTDDRLVEIDELLERNSSSNIRTRKGINWELTIDGRPVDVVVQQTAAVLYDCKDDLAAFGLSTSDAPYCVLLSAGLNGAVDYAILSRLAARISELVGGPFTEPSK